MYSMRVAGNARWSPPLGHRRRLKAAGTTSLALFETSTIPSQDTPQKGECLFLKPCDAWYALIACFAWTLLLSLSHMVTGQQHLEMHAASREDTGPGLAELQNRVCKGSRWLLRHWDFIFSVLSRFQV